ncbi:helix-turn-helix domain-containing protein [Duodenibacillus massiliensis]|uniref:helix-turn-helix domain-containing protein n=1 Tax=Duodenibacillus massiliensis TaxID=1852381 RepID=UPI002FDB6ED6
MPARSTTPFFARLIASRLYAARRAQGLTQAAVAQAAGVRTATVCQAENNPAHMQLETLAKIAAVLHLTVTAQATDETTAAIANPRISAQSPHKPD